MTSKLTLIESDVLDEILENHFDVIHLQNPLC